MDEDRIVTAGAVFKNGVIIACNCNTQDKLYTFHNDQIVCCLTTGSDGCDVENCKENLTALLDTMTKFEDKSLTLKIFVSSFAQAMAIEMQKTVNQHSALIAGVDAHGEHLYVIQRDGYIYGELYAVLPISDNALVGIGYLETNWKPHMSMEDGEKLMNKTIELVCKYGKETAKNFDYKIVQRARNV